MNQIKNLYQDSAIQSFKGKKCSYKECVEIVPYNTFNVCKKHLVQRICEVNKELCQDAFQELNGLSAKEPAGEYAKILRKCADE